MTALVSPSDSTDDGDLAPLVVDRTVVRLVGDLDDRAALAETLEREIRSGAGDVVIDLSAVTFMGATAIGELVSGRNHLRSRSRDLIVRSPSPGALRVLDVCGLIDLVERG